MKISGFSFVHNAIAGGYPIKEAIAAVRPYVDEVVVVDMQSDDGTVTILDRLGARVINHSWVTKDLPGRSVLVSAFEQHVECAGEAIVMFEADEVYGDELIKRAVNLIRHGVIYDLAVYRLQLEQNFQRCRWYPTPVHRIFPKGGGSYLQHPTNCPEGITVIEPDYGYLWDCANCFRDNWFGRKRQQSELWGIPRSLMVPEHFTHEVDLMSSEVEAAKFNEPQWTWHRTPFDIPDVLRPLVGKTRYHEG